MAAGDAVDEDAVGDEMVSWGRAARVETRGRRSGRIRSAVVGFVDEPDGSVLVAADEYANWARNLLADPACRVTIGERSFDARAEELAGEEQARAVRELVLRYGTPSERLGDGPAFRLRPAPPAVPLAGSRR